MARGKLSLENLVYLTADFRENLRVHPDQDVALFMQIADENRCSYENRIVHGAIEYVLRGPGRVGRDFKSMIRNQDFVLWWVRSVVHSVADYALEWGDYLPDQSLEWARSLKEGLRKIEATSV
jgi:hypothetical protein